MKKIPQFKTEQEMRNFRDTRDCADYFEDMDDDEISVEFKREKGVLVIPLCKERARSVRGIALEESISSNVILENWIDECIKAREKLKKYSQIT